MSFSPLQHLPIRLSEDLSEVTWLFAGDKAFTEPFFDETLSQLRLLPENLPRPWPVSPAEALLSAIKAPHAPVAAVIFHVSRCGSTLLSQLLGQIPAYIVLAEVPFLDQVLRKTRLAGLSAVETRTWLAAAVAAHTRLRAGRGLQTLIKTDSWHLAFYDHYRSLWPDAPRVLLYRHPAEVLRSQQKRRGIHAVPGLIEAELVGLHPAEVTQIQQDVYMAQVLESYFTTMLEVVARDPAAVLLNYQQGPVAMVEKLVQAVQLPLAADQWAGIRERAGYHAKYPVQPFVPDVPVSEIPDFLEKAVALYQKLDQVRVSQGVAG